MMAVAWFTRVKKVLTMAVGWLIRAEKPLSVLANCVVIMGIAFAYIQIRQQSELEKTRVAIDTASQVYSSQFVSSYAKLVGIYDRRLLGEGQNKDYSKIDYITELNFVMNTFNKISLIYNNNVADNCILQKSVKPLSEEFLPVLNYLLKPFEEDSNQGYSKEFHCLLKNLADNVCSSSSSSEC